MIDSRQLLKPFVIEARTTATRPAEQARLVSAAAEYIRRTPRIFKESFINDLSACGRMVLSTCRWEYSGVSKQTFLLLLAGLAYFVSPLDAIPDALPIVGFLDDVAVLSWVFTQVRHELSVFVEWERTQNKPLAATKTSD